MKIVAALLTVLVQIPIWFYLVYKILVMVNATELMWFLYWIYVPASMLTSIISNLLRAKE
jgi:hypothetical protein